MPRNIVGPRGAAREAVAQAGPQASLVYHGGPLLANVEVTTIYWGSAWTSDPLRAQLDAFFDFIVGSSLIDQLSEYSVPGFTIGHGSHVQSVFITSEPPNPCDDSVVQAQLDSMIASGMVGPPDANSVYFFFLPSGVTVTLQGSSSCQQFCGYHNLSGSGVVYAVDTYDDCQGCQFVPGDTLASSTVVASHELCESITDPQLNAWFDDNTGFEIGDICEGSNKVINADVVLQQGAVVSPTFNVSVSPTSVVIDGTAAIPIQVMLTPVAGPPLPPPTTNWTVQTEWSNAQGACV